MTVLRGVLILIAITILIITIWLVGKITSILERRSA